MHKILGQKGEVDRHTSQHKVRYQDALYQKLASNLLWRNHEVKLQRETTVVVDCSVECALESGCVQSNV